MPRPPSSPEHRARERARLRQAALEIHRDEGIEAVTVRSVTRLAGVSSGAFYQSFGSIHELVRSLWLEPVLATGPGISAIVDEHDDPVERLRALLRAFVDFVATNPEIHRRALLYVRPAGAPRGEHLDVAELPFFAALRATIDDGQSAGAFRTGDPARLAQLAWSAIHGALALPVNAELFDLDAGSAVADDMIDLVVERMCAV